MSKKERSTIILLENMQKSLNQKDKIIEKLNAQIKLLENKNKFLEQKVDFLIR